jgi:hypothetical protein
MINPTLLTILLLAGISATNLAEAWLEAIVIRLKNGSLPDYAALNKAEHSRSFIYSCLVCAPYLGIAAAGGFYWILGAIVINRRLVFDTALRKFRGRKLHKYEGDGSIDGFMRGILGENGALLESGIWALVTAGLAALQLFTN